MRPPPPSLTGSPAVLVVLALVAAGGCGSGPTGKKHVSSVEDEQRSRVDDPPKQVAEAQARQGEGDPAHPSPTAAPGAEPQPPVFAAATRRLAAMHARLGADAPTCTKLPDGVEIALVESLRRAAGVTLAADDPLSKLPPRTDQAFAIYRMLNEYNPPESQAEGAREFMEMPAVLVYVPERLVAPTKQPDGTLNPGRLDVRAVLFTGDTLTCATRWRLVTPDTLFAGDEVDRITEQAVRETAAKNLHQQFVVTRIPLGGT